MKINIGFIKNRLGIKFLITVGLVIFVMLASLFYWMAKRQEAQIIAQIDQQARILFKQIVLTRSWVAAQNGGVYSEIQGDIEPNPYLQEIEGLTVNITGQNGIEYTLRNPALVTRELSELAEGKQAYAFHITSLNPLNPVNAPTEWEEKALKSFETGEKEDDFIIETTSDGEVYRYMAPLYVKEGCMRCHAQQGYQVGDVRGGISVMVPMTEASAAVQMNTLQLSLAGFFILMVVLTIIGLLIDQQISAPLGDLQEAATAIAAGELDRDITAQSKDEVGQLADAFSVMTGRLRDSIAELEENVKERTQHLKRHSTQLEAAAAVGRAASTILDAGKLQQDIVTIIRERFDLYYVGLFLIDESNKWAVLQAGTGEAGKAMLARKHRLRIGEGMVGWSIANARPRVAEEVGEDAVQLATKELPETRSEAAIPLRARGKVIGALTVQDNEPNSFDEATISVLQIMADQVGIALANSQLYVESQDALETSRRAYGQISEEAWASLIRRQSLGFKEDESGTTPILPNADFSSASEKNLPELEIPLKIYGRVIGNITAHKSRKDGDWTAAEIEIMQILSQQLNIALESARLYEDTQRRAVHEQIASKVSAHMRETLDMDTILQTAIQELQQTFDLEEVEIRLGTPNETK